jgi:hypothetical protein
MQALCFLLPQFLNVAAIPLIADISPLPEREAQLSEYPWLQHFESLKSLLALSDFRMHRKPGCMPVFLAGLRRVSAATPRISAAWCGDAALVIRAALSTCPAEAQLPL